MEVQFVIRVDDILALHGNYLRRRPRAGGQQWLVALACLLLMVMVWYNYVDNGAVGDAVAPFALSVVCVALAGHMLLARQLVAVNVLRQLRRQLEEDEWNEKLLGWRRLNITPESITFSGKSTTASAQWEAIEQIVVTEHHVFFFLTRSSGFILPVRAFSEEYECRDFVRTARGYRRAAADGPRKQRPPRLPSRTDEAGFTTEELSED
jgi:hypothetical protein